MTSDSPLTNTLLGLTVDMKCDICNKPAVVHEVTVKNGVTNEIHLCKEHAEEAGVAMPTHQPINQLLTQFVMSQGDQSSESARKSCPGCGTTFSQFRQTGTLGCPECYDAFEEQLAPLIERAQNGATHHRGKVPKRAGDSLDRTVMIRQLTKELDQAVTAEQYERAAELRDRLRHIDETPASSQITKQAKRKAKRPPKKD